MVAARVENFASWWEIKGGMAAARVEEFDFASQDEKIRGKQGWGPLNRIMVFVSSSKGPGVEKWPSAKAVPGVPTSDWRNPP